MAPHRSEPAALEPLLLVSPPAESSCRSVKMIGAMAVPAAFKVPAIEEVYPVTGELDDLAGRDSQGRAGRDGHVAFDPIDDVRIVPGRVAGQRSAVNLETVDPVAGDGDAADRRVGGQVHADGCVAVVAVRVVGQRRIAGDDAHAVAGGVLKRAVGQREPGVIQHHLPVAAVASPSNIYVVHDVARAARLELDGAPAFRTRGARTVVVGVAAGGVVMPVGEDDGGDGCPDGIQRPRHKQVHAVPAELDDLARRDGQGLPGRAP